MSADSIQYLVDYITYINPTDANTIANDDIFIYVVSFILVFLVLKLIKMPWEYGLISHMALIGGPVTIGPLCDNYNWKDMVLPGCILAVLGQAMGAYLGLGAANLILKIVGC